MSCRAALGAVRMRGEFRHDGGHRATTTAIPRSPCGRHCAACKSLAIASAVSQPGCARRSPHPPLRLRGGSAHCACAAAVHASPRYAMASHRAPPPMQWPGVVGCTNIGAKKRLAVDWGAIQEHPLFAGIQQDQPNRVPASERGEAPPDPFSVDDYEVSSVCDGGTYSATVNFFALNPLYTATPFVPINEAVVDALADFYFKDPRPFPLDMLIRVPWPEYDPAAYLGAWECCGPVEMRYAFIRAIARDVRRGDDSRLASWRAMALTATADFEFLESELTVFFAAARARERAAVKFVGLSMSAYQRVWELHAYRAIMREEEDGPKTIKALALTYNQLALGNKVGPDVLSAARNVYNKAFKLLPVVKALGPKIVSFRAVYAW